MRKKKNYWKKNYNLFLNSFKKTDKRLIYIALCDFLFFLLLIGGLYVWNSGVAKGIESIPKELLENPENLSPEKTQETALLMKDYLISIVGYTILLVIFIFLIWCLFKGYIWNLALKKKFNLKYYGKFLLLNLLWIAIWLVPLILLFILLKTKPSAKFLVIILVFLVYFTNILYILFTKNNLIMESIKNAFNLGFNKIHLFVLPYVLIILAMVVVSLVTWPTSFLPVKVYTFISTLALVFLLAWARLYLADVVKDVSR